MNNIIEVDNLEKRYGDVAAVDGVRYSAYWAPTAPERPPQSK